MNTLLFIPNYSHLNTLIKNKSNIDMILLFIYQIIVIIYAAIEQASLFDGGVHATIYTWFCIFFIICLQTRDIKEFNSDIFVKIGWWSTGFFSVVLSIIATDFYRSFLITAFLPMGSDRLTVSVIAFSFLVFSLCYSRNSKFEKMCMVFFTAGSLISMIVCLRKGAIFSLIIIIISYIYKSFSRRLTNKRFIRVILIGFIIAISSAIIVCAFPRLIESIDTGLYQIRWVIMGLIGKNHDTVYNSGAIRTLARQKLWSDYIRNYSLIDYIFGKGYSYGYIDFPVFTAFTNLGIFGGLLYFYVQIVTPLKRHFIRTKDKSILFFQYYTIYTMLESFYSGVSYGHYSFIPIIILVFCTQRMNCATGDTQIVSIDGSRQYV